MKSSIPVIDKIVYDPEKDVLKIIFMADTEIVNIYENEDNPKILTILRDYEGNIIGIEIHKIKELGIKEIKITAKMKFQMK